MSSPIATDSPADRSVEPSASRSGSRKSKLVRAGLATLAGQSANVIITIGATVVLARLLEPADFGLVAMVYALVSFINSFRDFGLPMAALQSRDLNHLQSSALFWTNLPISILVTLFMILMGPVLAWFYGEPRLVLLTAAMSAGVLVPAMANQHEAILTRQLRFSSLVQWDLGFHVAGASTAILLALAGAGYWALASQFILWQAGRAVTVWIFSGWRPAGWEQVKEARKEVRHLVAFGAYLTGFRIISSLRDLDRVLIGYLSGAHALGLYDAALKWSRLPIQQIYSPLLGPAVAGLSHVRDDPEAYRRNARSILTPVLACSIPVLIYAAVFGDSLILLLLGPKWEQAIVLFRWLCIGGIAHAVLKTTKWFYVSLGNTRRQFRWGLISTPIFVLSIALGALGGPEGVAMALASAHWALILPALAYCLSDAPLGVRQYVAILLRPLLTATLAGAAAWGMARYIGLEHPAGELLLSAPLFALAYLAAWLALPGGREAAADALRLVRAMRSGGAPVVAIQHEGSPA